MNQNFLSELITRLRTTQPAFFKKLQLVAIILGSICAFLGFIVSHGAAMPVWVIDVSKYLTSACGSAVFVSLLPNQDINQSGSK